MLAAGSAESTQFGPSLALAEKWTIETGRKTQRTQSDPLHDGTRIPLLVITHGVYSVHVREQGPCIIVGVQIRINADKRAKFATLTPEVKQRLLLALRGELSSNTRNMFSYFPQMLTGLELLEAITVEQLLKISDESVTSFNRFCDAIQEVVTVAGKAAVILGLFTPEDMPTTTATRSAAADSLYG